ncbi:RasGAP protein, C-terminal domain and Calponin homology domain and Ras GTPase-activating protein domain and Rho GTPase activation protein domain-containing protein [Strongyloides ratti]|uniref:RasGAP protein, C-terminal domain and Calponin homology domain and Ras GTPase-activating protein domain and Rho GTPase activation protein domain-containing protein n=1 Tax=Strongyloides ratti TaxID=34506 RepID=A0A090LK55_STRRB|nr:RasGAP protein, C-terminal domain and Calponin homology domain and Ras GTPase-activating protein domain and Rho GTPase activation protein domain-containing protein [Strongyloides ratti]CEF67925.1 RasGAP protein, C-terminal domain and Calponin homology domain and Ras GTPase-activating protein domain and Rho GTPase activation protein domain-containing protein [Strongyloides ratti]
MMTDNSEIQNEMSVGCSNSGDNHWQLDGNANGIRIEKLDFKIGELSAELMDEKRKNRRAYDYLCRLSEVRTWIGEILHEEDIPAPIDLEANLSNGVLLARIGNKISHTEVPLSKIYDIDQSKYVKDGLQYRHTDNIMLWRHALTYAKFPEIIIPETVDVYQGKNWGTIYCLYTLAVYLFRLRKGPPIKNQSGNVEFRQCDIDKMKERLEDMNIPSFNDVDDILNNRFETDGKERAKIVLMINQLIEESEESKVEELISLLTNTDGDFLFIKEEYGTGYWNSLLTAKKTEEGILSHDKIQFIINNVNDSENLHNLNTYLLGDCDFNNLKTILYELCGEKVTESVTELYDTLLREKRLEKGDNLNLEEVLEIIYICNSCMKVKLCVIQGSVDDVYDALGDKYLQLNNIIYSNMKDIYYIGLTNEVNNREWIMSQNELKTFIIKMNNLSNKDLKAMEFIEKLKNNEHSDNLEIIFKSLEIENALVEFLPLYFSTIANESSVRFLNYDDIVLLVNKVNLTINEVKVKSREVWLINSALRNEEPYNLIEALKSTHWYDDGIIRDHVLHWYPATFDKVIFEKGIDKNKELKWINYKTDIGNFYINDSDFSLGPQEVFEGDFLTELDIEEIIEATNNGFDDYYKINEDSIIKGQKVIRKHLENKANIKDLEEKTKAAKIIQDNFRRYRRKQNLDTLYNCADPPLSLVRKFIDLLQNTDLDYEEELTFERTKSQVTRLITNNRNMDLDLDELDHKIGLLVRHRISLEEVLAHKNKVANKISTYCNAQESTKRKEKIQLIALEQLLFHLQTEPQYLSNLYYVCHDENLYEKALLPLYNFVSEKREEFLFVSLCREILKKYIDSTNDPKKFVNVNDQSGNKLAKFLREFFQTLPSYDLLGISIKDTHASYQSGDHSMRINLNLSSMFEEKHQRSPTDVYEVLTDNDIVKVLDESKNFIIHWSKVFASQLLNNLNLPKSIKYLMKVTQVELRNKFPNLSTNKITAMVSFFLWKCYFEPTLVEGKIFKRESGLTFSDDQNERLNMIAKLIGYASLGKSYGTQEPHLVSLNETIMEIHKKFLDLVNDSLENINLDHIYEANQCSSIAPTQKPTLYIALNNLKYLVSLLDKNKEHVFGTSGNRLKKLFETIDMIYDEEKFGDHLTLTLMAMPPEEVSPSIDLKELFVQTKRYFVDLLLCGVYGDTVSEVLETEINDKHEEVYRELINNSDDAFPSLEAKKQKICENLVSLSNVGMVSRKNNYQELINQIASEIIRQGEYRQNRAKQIGHFQETIKRLEDKKKDYEDRLEKYKLFLDSCLENMKRNSLKPRIKSESQRASKLLTDREKLLNPKSVKLNGEKLIRKEILKSKTLSNKELSKINFEINFTGKIDEFEIVVKKPKMDSIMVYLNFQELLEHEFNQIISIPIIDDISFNVGPLIGYLNKKFYAK